MRVSANGRLRRSRKEWQEILDRFSASELSESAFCRKEELAKSSFSKWKRRLRGDEHETASRDFVELVTPAASSECALGSGEFMITLPGGVVLRWRS